MQLLVLLNFAAALQGIFLTYLIAHNRLKELKSVVLGTLTLVLSVSLLGGVYGLSGFYKTFPHFTNVADPLFLLYGPLLYTYIFVLTHQMLPKNYLLNFLPFVVYVAAFIPFYLKSGEEKIQFAEYIFLNEHVPLEALLMQLARIIHISIYSIASLILLNEYQRKIKNNFSDIEKISLSQAKRILYFFISVLAVGTISYILGYLFSYSFTLSNNIVGLAIGIIIYALAYSTWNPKEVQPEKMLNVKSAKEQNSETGSKLKGRRVFVLNDQQILEYSSRLKQAIENDKAFIENEISLAELSEKIGIQPYQLSELISREYGESFFDFINRHRIEEFKTRIGNPKFDSYSLLGIAMDCGFNSKSSFNTAFKKFTGLTPSEYRKQKAASPITQ